MKSLSFGKLSPTEFEEFSLDLLQAVGYLNVDWRKGTGLNASPADSGRDIVFQEKREHPDGTQSFETWFADCKHYKKGVPPNELQNLISWAEAERPDGIIFIVSNFLSNPAKDYLERFRKNNRPHFKIKYWERPMLEKLASRKISLLRKYDLTSIPIRTTEKLLRAEKEFSDKIWYDRHQLMKDKLLHDKSTPADIIKGALQSAKRMEALYGKKNLGPYEDFEWGMINGKLSALRWVLGDDWDMLDT